MVSSLRDPVRDPAWARLVRTSAGAVDGFESLAEFLRGRGGCGGGVRAPAGRERFTIRSFWLVSALTEVGEASRAPGRCARRCRPTPRR